MIKKVIDLCAGPGGWDVAARDLGLDVIGIEWDAAACDTRRAAGLQTIQGDIRDYRHLITEMILGGLIASPPCQTFSAAGKGAGRRALDDVLLGVKTLAARQEFDASVFDDERTGLVLEPLIWALTAIDAGRPFEWLAFEQVPAVLPVWEAMAEVLRAEGYGADTAIMNAEQYGVPQTRRRAVLVARYDEGALIPDPTHSRYYPRTPDKLDPFVWPWVSMAEALGWTSDAVLRSNYGTGGDPAKRGERHLSEPAATVTGKADRGNWVLQGNQKPDGVDYQARAVGAPAQTLTGNSASYAWVHSRPATTVVGSFCPDVIAAPGYRKAGGPSRQNAPGSVKVTAQEAATLQTFPADYPWQGTKSKQFQQIGNAVPPLLARAILKAVTDGR